MALRDWYGVTCQADKKGRLHHRAEFQEFWPSNGIMGKTNRFDYR
jgi:hypothetical protein